MLRQPTSKEMVRSTWGGAAEADPHTTLDLPVGPGEVGGLLKGLLGKIGVDALGPLAAGMIRMGGKEYPTAMLHRAIGNPEELGWWGKLFQRGLSSEKPTSAVTPNVLSTFKSEPYGLLFNVPEEKVISWAAPLDAGSTAQEFFPSGLRLGFDALSESQRARYSDAYDHLIFKAAKLIGNPPPVTDNYLRNTTLWQPWWRALNEASPPLAKALGFVEEYPRRVQSGIAPHGTLTTQKWTALHDMDYEPGPYWTLGHLLDDQRAWLVKRMKKVKNRLVHSEIVPEIDKSMLAGVRLPFNEPPYTLGSVSNDFPKGQPGIANELYRELTNFAEQMNVPIYRWPAVTTQEQQLKGLQDPFAGKWGYKPGTREYITSSRLPQIFGITELP